MANETLLVDAAFLVAAAFLYAQVARVTLRRRVEGEGRLAATLFSVFWLSLASLQAMTVAGRVAAWAGYLDVAFFATLSYAAILIICVAFWALDYYLFYLLLGTRRVLGPLTAVTVAFYVYAVFLITSADPIAVEVDTWRTRLVYANPIGGSTAGLVAGLLLILPPFIGAIGYIRLYFKIHDPTQRYRIGLVSITLAAWMGSSLLAWAIDVNSASWWPYASRSIGVCAALLVFAAYRPPGWVRRRWGIEAVDEASAG